MTARVLQMPLPTTDPVLPFYCELLRLWDLADAVYRETEAGTPARWAAVRLVDRIGEAVGDLFTEARDEAAERIVHPERGQR